MKIRNIKACVFVAAGLLLGGQMLVGAGKKSHESELYRQLNTFNSIVRELENNYVDSIPAERVMNRAIRSMLSEIDPYTEFFTAEDVKAFRTETTGEYAGIGSYIMQRDSMVYFSGPYEGSPAALAGLKSGDRIMRIDTADVSKSTSERVSKLLRGNPDTQVRVRISRPYAGPDSILDFTITRKKLQLPSVPYYGVERGNVGYIKLNSFMETSADEVKKALEEFKGNPAVKGVVLDLRGNGGGLVQSAVEIAGFFLPKGTEILRTKGKNASETRIYRTTHKPIMEDMPLAVLIDGGSASASEIVAGAMQDLDRGVLIGSRSFGKGLVQGTRQLPYNQMIKITTAKYYMPSGRLIQALDYSRRNADGTVAHTPDSLCNTYKTKNGREVKDGGGLKPEVEIDWGNVSLLTFNLVRDNWIFDYATKFAAANPSIPSPREFEITDSIYADFKAGIDPAKLKYDKVCDGMLDELEKVAEREGYMNDSTKAEFGVIRKLLTHNLDEDLDAKRKDISEYLGQEIVSRYYYNRGESIYTVKDDEALDKAAELLSDPKALKDLGIVVTERKE
ncbi:MAG: S41 family peptidase [Prevotella sp.]|nr:S41 family peptidase [Prevotella sp.]MCM1074887.1 S41 family peptidase [Ruminococcus sp.]